VLFAERPSVGDRVPFLIIRGKSGRKNKALFVDRAEDPAFVLENNMPQKSLFDFQQLIR